MRPVMKGKEEVKAVELQAKWGFSNCER